MGKTFKDQRDWDRKQSGRPRHDDDDTFERKNHRQRLTDLYYHLDEDDLVDYDEFELDDYE